MSRRTQQTAEPQRYVLLMPSAELSSQLQARIEEGKRLRELRITTEQELDAAKRQCYIWTEYNEELLKRAVNTDELWKKYAGFGGLIAVGDIQTLEEAINEYRRDVDDSINRLQSIQARLPLIPEGPSIAQSAAMRHGGNLPSSTVFVVHGHEEAAKQSVARFIEHLGLDAIILHERPDLGRTIIEKLEDHAQGAAFAVIILTADDRGGLSDVGYDEQKPRARQNVVMELGYFIGKLGRQKVCALYQEGVELPSDLQGVLYVTLDDSGAWRFQLAKEMKAAGLEVDMNKAL